MLSTAQKQLIADEAAAQTRLTWGRANPRSLGELAVELTARVANRTLSTPTFSEFADAQYRQAHAERLSARDEAFADLLANEPELLAALKACASMQGPDGIVTFALAHDLEPADCAAILEQHDLTISDEALEFER